ncbi:MAG: (Fe-S)-binding protein [Bacteroidetes bacterium]|nr:(Fe-S)-binding protein [Bacteroidota bacterium]
MNEKPFSEILVESIPQIFFAILLSIGLALFIKNIQKLIRNINLGRDKVINDRRSERWRTMAMVALGQSKMMTRPVAGFFHILIYAGFIIINIEVLEIILDGIFGTHRLFEFLGPLYNFLIGGFEILALLVLVACVVFLMRRNVLKLKRFWMREMTSFPRTDANLILITEIVLMSLFLFMNASDSILQKRGIAHYVEAGSFPVSKIFVPLLTDFSSSALIAIERFCWWLHIIGILAFMNYLPYSKHLHILFAFPNTWYSDLDAKGKFNNLESVTQEVKLMLDPSLPPPASDGTAQRFGAKDVQDLTWKQLMDAYSCTECGRCTSQCPANITGKKLSPRKIMMDTRDRLDEVGKQVDMHGIEYKDGKALLGDYITEEELWACNTCNACVQACPVNINPLSIIMDMRRYLVMEQSAAPAELNGMFTKIENNQAPWQFSPADRMNWAQEN